MEIFNTEDNTVSKFIHKDGSETSIKHVSSCSYTKEGLEEEYITRKKYTIFISNSVGCFMKCNFCHLTLKQSKYQMLSNEEILNNLKEAIIKKLEISPELKDYYVKLSWMGMGDALIEAHKVKEVSLELLDWILENKYAKGLDGVDLSSVFPNNSKSWIEEFNELNDRLKTYPQNPNNEIMTNNLLEGNKKYKGRTPFRLFYSIHTLKEDSRKEMIPNSMSPYDAIEDLTNSDLNFNVIFHYLFVEGQNDSEEEIKRLEDILDEKLNKYELRILRYNFCDKSPYRESLSFQDIIKRLVKHTDNIKIQLSPGSEVKAACGQFIVRNFK